RVESALWRERLKMGFRFSLSYSVALGVLAGLATLPFPGAITAQKPTITASTFDDDASWPLPESPLVDAGALYVHSRLMKVAISRSGVPVLRFVECRHYPPGHLKLVQTGLTSAGHSVLRFMPGDYCLFGSASAQPTTRMQLTRGLGTLQEVRADRAE